jgi:hypothetical protein
MSTSGWVLCPKCRRHLRAEESCCPFCCRSLHRNALAAAALAGIGCGLASTPVYGAFPSGPPRGGASTGSTGGSPGGGVQYCGIPDGGTPIPCNELDGGNPDGGPKDGG